MMLSNRLRIVPANAADTALLSASSSASADLGVDNLQVVGRTEIWRAAGTVATLTAELDSAMTPVQCIAVMTSNWSAAATWQVRVFSGTAATYFDSGTLLACPPLPLDQFDWGFAPLGVNAFSSGLPVHSVIWLPERVPAASVQIEINDQYNPDGHVEASRLVIGDVWSPETNFSTGSVLTWGNTDKQSRSEDGTLRTEVGIRMRKMSISFQGMPDSDRNRMAEIARQIGMKRDFLISACPQANPLKAADHTMMAKFTRDMASSSVSLGRYQQSLEIEES